jgi:glycosyltransferase involved in cell wall biosynthesis
LTRSGPAPLDEPGTRGGAAGGDRALRGGEALRLVAYLPHHNDGASTHSYACLSLCEHMQGEDLAVKLHVPTADAAGRRRFVREAVPGALKGVAYRLDPTARLVRALARRRFRRALRGADVAYLWAATPEAVYADVREAGVPLVVERVNCHRATSRAILEDAFRRAGIPPAHGITEESLAEERRKLAMADWIFAPSPLVRRSLLEEGIPEERILSVGYGWSPRRVALQRPPRAAGATPAFLFLGTVCVRKGAHLLLDAWAAAGGPGRLEICGPVLPEISTLAAHHLARPDVATPGPVAPFARAIGDAEVFAFPTLEEGSSLAVLEAMASGLAILTTPMGAGEIVRDGVEGIVLDPFDREAWVAALRRLASEPSLRARLGEAAELRARQFTWAKVGAKRRELIARALRLRPGRRSAEHEAARRLPEQPLHDPRGEDRPAEPDGEQR